MKLLEKIKNIIDKNQKSILVVIIVAILIYFICDGLKRNSVESFQTKTRKELEDLLDKLRIKEYSVNSIWNNKLYNNQPERKEIELSIWQGLKIAGQEHKLIGHTLSTDLFYAPPRNKTMLVTGDTKPPIDGKKIFEFPHNFFTLPKVDENGIPLPEKNVYVGLDEFDKIKDRLKLLKEHKNKIEQLYELQLNELEKKRIEFDELDNYNVIQLFGKERFPCLTPTSEITIPYGQTVTIPEGIYNGIRLPIGSKAILYSTVGGSKEIDLKLESVLDENEVFNINNYKNDPRKFYNDIDGVSNEHDFNPYGKYGFAMYTNSGDWTSLKVEVGTNVMHNYHPPEEGHIGDIAGFGPDTHTASNAKSSYYCYNYKFGIGSIDSGEQASHTAIGASGRSDLYSFGKQINAKNTEDLPTRDTGIEILDTISKERMESGTYAPTNFHKKTDLGYDPIELLIDTNKTKLIKKEIQDFTNRNFDWYENDMEVFVKKMPRVKSDNLDLASVIPETDLGCLKDIDDNQLSVGASTESSTTQKITVTGIIKLSDSIKYKGTATIEEELKFDLTAGKTIFINNTEYIVTTDVPKKSTNINIESKDGITDLPYNEEFPLQGKITDPCEIEFHIYDYLNKNKIHFDYYYYDMSFVIQTYAQQLDHNQHGDAWSPGDNQYKRKAGPSTLVHLSKDEEFGEGYLKSAQIIMDYDKTKKPENARFKIIDESLQKAGKVVMENIQQKINYLEDLLEKIETNNLEHFPMQIYRLKAPDNYEVMGDIVFNHKHPNYLFNRPLLNMFATIPSQCIKPIRDWQMTDKIYTYDRDGKFLSLFVNPYTGTFFATTVKNTVPPGKLSKVVACVERCQLLDNLIKSDECARKFQAANKDIISNNNLDLDNKFINKESILYENKILDKQKHLDTLKEVSRRMQIQDDKAEIINREFNKSKLKNILAQQKINMDKLSNDLKEGANKIDVNVKFDFVKFTILLENIPEEIIKPEIKQKIIEQTVKKIDPESQQLVETGIESIFNVCPDINTEGLVLKALVESGCNNCSNLN